MIIYHSKICKVTSDIDELKAKYDKLSSKLDLLLKKFSSPTPQKESLSGTSTPFSSPCSQLYNSPSPRNSSLIIDDSPPPLPKPIDIYRNNHNDIPYKPPYYHPYLPLPYGTPFQPTPMPQYWSNPSQAASTCHNSNMQNPSYHISTTHIW